MTIKEKWKMRLLEILMIKDISKIIEPYISYLRFVLSSVKKDGTVQEEFICSECYEKSKVTYVKDYRNDDEFVFCEHCGKKYEANRYASKNESNEVYWNDKYRYHGKIIMFAEEIDGVEGIAFIEIRSLKIEYDISNKRKIMCPEIIGYGFISKNGKYRYSFGSYTDSKVASYRGYRYPAIYIDDAVKEYVKKNELCVEQILDKNDSTSIIIQVEENIKNIPKTGVPISLITANRIIEKWTPGELPLNMMSMDKWLHIKHYKSDELTQKNYFQGYCSECGLKFSYVTGKYGYQKDVVCSKCGNSENVFWNASGISKLFVVVEKINDSKIICFRTLTGNYELSNNKKVIMNYTEKMRVYIDFSEESKGKRTVLLSNDGTEWRYKRNSELEEFNIDRANFIFSHEADETLKYTGLREFINTVPTSNVYGKEMINLNKIIYFLQVCTLTGSLEKLAKLGWGLLCDDIVYEVIRNDEIKVDLEGKNVNEILKLPKRLVKYLIEKSNNNPRPAEVLRVQKFYALDNDVMTEDMDWCAGNSVNVSDIEKICRLLNINVHKACEYLERVRISQCFSPKSAVVEWFDYLIAAQNIKADLSDKTVRYPTSLRREHDRATFKYGIIKDKQKEEKFQNICIEYGKKYSYENEEYLIVPPKDMQDLFEEGRKLNHCVGSYADRIIDSTTCICFVRKANEPDEPYFTVEVSPYEARVRQIHGLSNRLVDHKNEKSLASFLKEWAKKKKLDISVL